MEHAPGSIALGQWNDFDPLSTPARVAAAD
jgi:hypothetical protein